MAMTPGENFTSSAAVAEASGELRTESAATQISPPAPEHADFWLRLLAAAIDFAILALFVGVVASFYAVGARIPKQFAKLHPGQAPSEMIRIFGRRFLDFLLGLYIVCNWLYFAAAESSVWQATPGKRATGLYVADRNGRKINFGRASARFFAGRLLLHVPVAGLPYFWIDCMVAAFPPQKQALHDRVARCVVFRKAAGDFDD
jgi:uncharacterized RDD family membrane protein YckC